MNYRVRDLLPHYGNVVHIDPQLSLTPRHLAEIRLPHVLLVLEGNWRGDRFADTMQRLFPLLCRSSRILLTGWSGCFSDFEDFAGRLGYATIRNVDKPKLGGEQAGVLFRPQKTESSNPSLSIVIPAKNERGTIWEAVNRTPSLPEANTEIVFVEGQSTDGTWETIRNVQAKYVGAHHVVAVQQDGRGKADAVRCGVSHASGDLVAILDADLTVPPESLVAFYEAYRSGDGDFLNGDRMSLPMERKAMRWLNYCANKMFAAGMSYVIGIQLRDTLCGTKLFTRRDFQRFMAWRQNFGNYDPFGDFDLIVPAACLGIGITSIPVRYAARRYGTTQIHRFSDGLKLLRMCWRICQRKGC